ncbi:MAG: hypothetical protein R3B06_08955 [Kofleriaceae bacterium]
MGIMTRGDWMAMAVGDCPRLADLVRGWSDDEWADAVTLLEALAGAPAGRLRSPRVGAFVAALTVEEWDDVVAFAAYVSTAADLTRGGGPTLLSERGRAVFAGWTARDWRWTAALARLVVRLPRRRVRRTSVATPSFN